jgi:5'-deoxynucleotidase YfbR-like HD superfamily hydrolase
LQGGKPNKVENKTTVSDFVTHEPYTRTSSTALKKTYINEAMAEIKLNNPDFSAQELQDIKTQLLKKSSISAVSNQLQKIVRLNDKIKMPINKLNELKDKAKNIDSLIKNNAKNYAMNFVQGQISSAINVGISAVRSFFRF